MPSSNARRNGRSGNGAAKKAKVLSFEDFYSEVYAERWPELRHAMAAEPIKTALYNRCCQLPFADVTKGMVPVRPNAVTQAFIPANSSARDPEKEEEGPRAPTLIPKPPQDDFQIRGYYIMDYASALVVEQLNVGPFDKVLDLCAAPGGKSIAIAQFLSPDGQLVANETRADRCARLRRNLLDHIPTNFVPWTVTQRNAETWYDPGAYTRVLVDAPCSSERHLLQQSAGGTVDPREWQLESSKKLSRLQLSLLQRALETCAEGGRVVYSTCSISPFENDDVVSEALRTTRCAVQLIHPTTTPSLEGTAAHSQELSHGGAEPSAQSDSASSADPRELEEEDPSAAAKAAARAALAPPMGAPTTHGWLILPDTCDGWGPMYFAVLYKRKNHRLADSSSEEVEDSEEEG